MLKYVIFIEINKKFFGGGYCVLNKQVVLIQSFFCYKIDVTLIKLRLIKSRSDFRGRVFQERGGKNDFSSGRGNCAVTVSDENTAIFKY